MPRRHQTHRVYIAPTWEDEWELQAAIYCDWCKFAAGPDVAEALLSYNYGKITRANSTTQTTEGALSLDNYYVKVEIDQITDDDPEAAPIKWIGIIVDTYQERYGEEAEFSGTQKFACRGLEYLLERTILDKSTVMTADGNEKEIRRAIGFNLGGGHERSHGLRPNRAEEFGVNGAPIFDHTINDASLPWSGADILNYLLEYYPPKNADGVEIVPFSLDQGYSSTVLHGLQPTMHVHGMNLLQIINAMIDRRRVQSWTITHNDDDEPIVKVFTFNTTPIELPSGATVTANEDTTTLPNLDTDGTIQGAVNLTRSTASQFDVVIARGAPLGACFSLNAEPDFTLDADWNSGPESTYNAGATGAADYATLESWKKQARNEAARADDEVVKVYRHFRLNIGFDGKNGALPEDPYVCPNPETAEAGEHEGTESAPFWYAGLRFLPTLPLLTEHDYSGEDVLTPPDETLENSRAEYRRPFAVGWDDDANVFVPLHAIAMGVQDKLLTTNGGAGFSCSLRMQDDSPGIVLEVHGAPQHVIALDEFSEPDADAPDFPAIFRWQLFYVTVFAEFDQQVEAKWPEGDTETETDVLKPLIIEMPECRLDYLSRRTVLGVDDAGELIRAETGGYVRDDRDKLKDAARSAYEWYAQPRQAMDFVQRELVTDLRIGKLITTIGASANQVEVNSVVTQLTFNLPAGTVAVRTQFAELDLTLATPFTKPIFG